MGKEQELIEAARSGNIATVEKYLSQRARRTGPLASLRRGPGANAQDQSGYTSLHHAALNGHKEIVSMLLQYEASTNVVDHKGSTPLHLAAWTGNTDIVRMLLEQGPSVPNVNLANHDQETPLHSAAQYGHTEVVSILLKHEADPSVRSLRDETPLDLAAQYGRLDAARLLVSARPGLLRPGGHRPAPHSPLHLAARNGHRAVAALLLDAGFDVNFLTENGGALHEAALYGKIEVVKLLLDYGIDVNLENSSKRTVFNLLEELNTAISKQITRIILEHTTAVARVDDYRKSPYSASSTPSSFVSTPERQSSLSLLRGGSPMSDANDAFSSYNSSKRSSTASDTLRKSVGGGGSSCEHLSSRSPSVYETPGLLSADPLSSSTDSHTAFSPPDSSCHPSSRVSVPPGWKPLPPAKPPRRSITSLSPSGKGSQMARQSSPTPSDPCDLSLPRTPPSGFDSHNGRDAFSALYDEVASGKVSRPPPHRRRLTGDKPVPPAKPKTLDLRAKRQTIQIPLDPPPTPDFPPPSPATAAQGVHHKIRPLHQVGLLRHLVPAKILTHLRYC